MKGGEGGEWKGTVLQLVKIPVNGTFKSSSPRDNYLLLVVVNVVIKVSTTKDLVS